MSYEDKSKLTKFTERPSTSNSIIKMWVLLEGDLNSDKLEADISQVTDLADSQERVRTVKKYRNNTSILPGTCLQNLVNDTTAKNPLIVRYPLLKENGHKPGKTKIPHNTGSLNLLREAVVEKFKKLQTENFYFFNDGTKDEIWNNYHFNDLISQTELNGNYNLKLKVKIEDKKSYSDWELKDAFKDILQKEYDSLEDIPNFCLNNLPPLDHPFPEVELTNFVWELKKALINYNNAISTNEMTCRTYINAFITTANKHIIQHVDKKLRLTNEIGPDGSFGHGPTDYTVKIVDILVLICEAKSENMNKGSAKLIAQMHSAIEQQVRRKKEQQLGKRKREQMEPIVFGIVTTGKLWRFFRWEGSSESRQVQITEEFTCNFIDTMEPEKMLNSLPLMLLFTITDETQEMTWEDRMMGADIQTINRSLVTIATLYVVNPEEEQDDKGGG
ncbi:8720_t:CDS:2 [Diversispora eburnea]|uniref:8720_t:CDS:1 n=1 Tax=Diversispora eburnea TaxID=1213867 RepID=A0A9N9GBK5_9GLOM|nr:8720_t:CDS:2 [Diversispora eburnea]